MKVEGLWSDIGEYSAAWSKRLSVLMKDDLEFHNTIEVEVMASVLKKF